MAGRTKYLTAEETLDLITTKQWATSNDVYLLSGKGRNTTAEDIKSIREMLEEKGYRLPRGLLPMEEVVNFYKININYLKKVCSLPRNKNVDNCKGNDKKEDLKNLN